MADLTRNDNLIIDKGSIDTGKTVVTPITRSETGEGSGGFSPNSGTGGSNLLHGDGIKPNVHPGYDYIGNGQYRNPNTGELYTEDSQGNLISTGTNTNTPTDDSVWHGDPNKTAEENYNDLTTWLSLLFSQGVGSFSGTALFNGSSFVSLLAMSLKGLRQFVEDNMSWWYGNDYKWALFEKLVDNSQRYIDTIFNTALSYQSWYLQQDYNSPANQLKRLEEAGLSSAFVFNGVSSGNAQSAASVIPGVNQGSYGLAENAIASRQADQQYQLGMQEASTRASEANTALLQYGVDSVKTLAEADNITKLTPVQIATGIQNFLNLGVVYDKYRSEILKIENDMFSDWFKNDFASYQQDVANANQQVEQIQSNIDSASKQDFALSMGSRLIDTEVYTGYVRNKEKQLVRKDYTLDQLDSAWKNGGYDEEGNEVFSEEDRRTAASGSVSGGLNMPAIGVNLGASGTLTQDDLDKNSKTDSKKRGSSHEQGQTTSQSTGHYDDNSQTVSIGSQKFTRSVSRKLMQSKEYIDYMTKLRNDLQDAKDRFFTLTTGERSRAFMNYQMYLENKARGLSWSTHEKYKFALHSIFKSQPTTLVGD